MARSSWFALCGLLLSSCGDDAPTGTPATDPSDVRRGAPHADHAAKHGGQLVMAERYHVEGTLPDARLFRLWIYDASTRPLTASGTTAVARVTVKPRPGSTPPGHATVPMK